MSTTTEPRTAVIDDLETIARIGATGFYDDLVMTWVFPDPDARLEQAEMFFFGLGSDILPGRGTIHILEDACMSMWREPGFDDSGEDPGPLPYPDDVNERMGVLVATLSASHPHDPHWYLNFLSTVPERQGQGLGARTMAPVLHKCDTDGVPAYLEATGQRNMALYRRHGFVQTDEINVPDGPTLYPMWRDPQR